MPRGLVYDYGKVCHAESWYNVCRIDHRLFPHSPPLAAVALDRRPGDQAVFRSLMQNIMKYVLEKLSGKGVFHNTLMFAGRMLGKRIFFHLAVASVDLIYLPLILSVCVFPD